MNSIAAPGLRVWPSLRERRDRATKSAARLAATKSPRSASILPIITSQLPVKQWYDTIGEKTFADAILDRIVHAAHRIELKGESLRKNSNVKNDKINETND